MTASSARLFLTVRPTWAVLSLTFVLGGLAGWLGLVEAPLPNAVQEDGATIPLWRLLVMGAAVLPVLALSSPLADLESVATRRLRSMQRGYLAVLSAACASIYLSICAATLHSSVVGIIARSWTAWFGLALVTGTTLGWRLAWTLPSVVAIVLWYWGYSGDQRYRWWEFSARPYDDLPSLLLSIGLLVAGLIAYWMTPWRRHRWSVRIRRRS